MNDDSMNLPIGSAEEQAAYRAALAAPTRAHADEMLQKEIAMANGSVLKFGAMQNGEVLRGSTFDGSAILDDIPQCQGEFIAGKRTPPDAVLSADERLYDFMQTVRGVSRNKDFCSIEQTNDALMRLGRAVVNDLVARDKDTQERIQWVGDAVMQVSNTLGEEIEERRVLEQTQGAEIARLRVRIMQLEQRGVIAWLRRMGRSWKGIDVFGDRDGM